MVIIIIIIKGNNINNGLYNNVNAMNYALTDLERTTKGLGFHIFDEISRSLRFPAEGRSSRQCHISLCRMLFFIVL